MKKGLTELVLILDASGSMESLTGDTIGGFNSMIEKQKKTDGEVLVSAVTFNTESKVIYDRVPLAEVRRMTERDYVAGGCTALIDAVGDAVHHIRTVHKYIREEDRPEHTLFVITTDGYENASRRRSSDEVKKMIRAQEKDGWEFLFLGANIDAVETAASFGIGKDHAVDYVADSVGTALAMDTVYECISDICDGGALAPSWKARLAKDYAKRGKKS